MPFRDFYKFLTIDRERAGSEAIHAFTKVFFALQRRPKSLHSSRKTLG
jgi:hypothetical protein